MDHRFNWCMEDEKKVNRVDLKAFRQFSWLLDDAQFAKVEQWQSIALVNARARIAHHGAIEDHKKEGKDTTTAASSKDGRESKQKRDANNDAALVLDSALSKVAKVDEPHEAAEETESLSGLSSFFGAKAFST